MEPLLHTDLRRLSQRWRKEDGGNVWSAGLRCGLQGHFAPEGVGLDWPATRIDPRLPSRWQALTEKVFKYLKLDLRPSLAEGLFLRLSRLTKDSIRDKMQLLTKVEKKYENNYKQSPCACIHCTHGGVVNRDSVCTVI